MKASMLRRYGMTTALVMVLVIARANEPPNQGTSPQERLEKTRLELRAQGFKTGLTDFDFSTGPELQAREAVLKAAAWDRNNAPFTEHPDTMEPAGDNRAIVVWEQSSLRRRSPSWPDGSYELSWDDFRDAVDERQPEIDAACAAILAGPVQFDLNAAHGNFMLLPHLALLKDLTETLDDRVLLALHDGNREAAWTNLMAATRLVTAWKVEPAMISHQVRFNNTRLVFGATWQALQFRGWTEDRLAHLQHEWESADFLGPLPEVQAFRRASDVQSLEQDQAGSPEPAGELYKEEKRLLLFYRDREIEFRRAVQAGTWKQMRPMPGVTNEIYFEPGTNHWGRFEMSLSQRRMRAHIEGDGISFLGRAAEAETERRIIITALALERYREKHQKYPEILSVLTPEFIKSVPVDFMTGDPLHYRTAKDGHFLLYSVGLDCTDNGGKIQIPSSPEERFARLRNPGLPVPESDIVWPLPASSAKVVAFRQAQSRAEAERKAKMEAQAKVQEQNAREEAEDARRAAMKRLLAEKPSLGKEPVYQGKPLSTWVIKAGQVEEYDGAPKDAVAAIRAIGPKAVPFLLEWMPHPGAERPVEGYPDWDAVEIAWWALGTEGKSAIPTLAEIIGRPQRGMDDYSSWTEGAKAISHLGPDAIVPMLTVATNMHGQHVLWELLHNFENLGTNGTPAIPALLHWTNDPDEFIRDAVVSALGGIGTRPELAIPVLTNTLEHDSSAMVRRDAGEALGAFAGDSPVVLSELIKIVNSPPDSETRSGALLGLGKVQNKAEVVVPVIVPFLHDENSVVERCAAYALRDLGSEAGFKALDEATNNPNICDIIYEVQKKNRSEQPQ